jgi:Plavaka transposase
MRPRKRARPEQQDVNVDHGGPSYNESTDPPVVQSARSGRTVRIPRRLRDYLPHGDMSLAHVPPRAPTPPESDDRLGTPTVEEPHTADPEPHPLQTNVNKIGIFLRYTHAPSWHPRIEERRDLICDSPPLDTSPPVAREAIHELFPVDPKPFEPFPNLSVALFMATYFSGTEMKSETHATDMATAITRISPDEMLGFNAHTENVRLNKFLQHGTNPFQTRNGWQDSTVHITLPVENKSFRSEDDAPTLPVQHLYHRRIVDIIKSVCASTATSTFHFTPFSMHWCPDPDNPRKHERVYADTYMSDYMIQAQEEIDELSREEGDSRERVVLGLMLASDSAQLTSFGTASVWPVYLMFANQPKQERVRPTCHAVHHLAYVPSVGVLVANCYSLTISTDWFRLCCAVPRAHRRSAIVRNRNSLQA